MTFYMRIKALVIMMVLGATLSKGVLAATQLVTSSITFGGAPITMVINNTLDFGAVEAGSPGTYTVSTAGALSYSGPGIPEGGTASAANITIAGSLTQNIGITVGNIVANNGVTLANLVCDYNGGGSGSCTINGGAPAGTGKTLLVGGDAVVGTGQSDGTVAHPSFDVTVVYQ